MRVIMLCLCGVVLIVVGTMPLVAQAAGPTTLQAAQSAHPSNTGAESVVILGACVMMLAATMSRARVHPE